MYNGLNPTEILIKIVKIILSIIRGFLMSIGALVILLPIILVILLRDSASTITIKKDINPVPKNVPLTLRLDLEGVISEKEPGLHEEIFRRLFGEEDGGIYLPHLRRVLRAAEKDENVKGLEIDLNSLSGSFADFTEMRRILEEFKRSGKKIQVYLVSGWNYSYYLASVADHIMISPTSELFIPGPMFNLIYFGKLLQDLGIDAEVLRAGKYKSAFESFVANVPSKETMEMYESIEADLRGFLVEKVAQGRKKEISQVKGWFEQGIYTAKSALSEGLVDGVGFYDDHLAMLQAGIQSKVEVKFKDYKGYVDKENITGGEKGESGSSLALIEAVGNIMLTSFDSSSEEITPRKLTKELNWARTDKEVKAVVLRIASPGGSATAADLIWKEVKNLAAVKPVVVSMGSVAASGGYYIAAPAKKIFAEPTTITGSIGVIGMLLSCEACVKKYGVSGYVISQSARKKLFNFTEKSSAFDKTLMEGSIDEVYQIFMSRVSEGRNMPMEKVDAIGQGRVYTGDQAKNLGLVDELGGLNEAFQAAKELAGLKTDKLYPILRYQEDKFPFETILDMSFNDLRLWGGGAASFWLNRMFGNKITMVFPQTNSVLDQVSLWQGLLKQDNRLVIWPDYLAWSGNK